MTDDEREALAVEREEAVHQALNEHGHRFSLNAADVRDLGAIIISTIRTAVPEPQGEPSDVQVEAALEAFAHRDAALANREDMIAALRAASAVEN